MFKAVVAFAILLSGVAYFVAVSKEPVVNKESDFFALVEIEDKSIGKLFVEPVDTTLLREIESMICYGGAGAHRYSAIFYGKKSSEKGNFPFKISLVGHEATDAPAILRGDMSVPTDDTKIMAVGMAVDKPFAFSASLITFLSREHRDRQLHRVFGSIAARKDSKAWHMDCVINN